MSTTHFFFFVFLIVWVISWQFMAANRTTIRLIQNKETPCQIYLHFHTYIYINDFIKILWVSCFQKFVINHTNFRQKWHTSLAVYIIQFLSIQIWFSVYIPSLATGVCMRNESGGGKASVSLFLPIQIQLCILDTANP